jgi:hypothetical protein
MHVNWRYLKVPLELCLLALAVAHSSMRWDGGQLEWVDIWLSGEGGNVQQGKLVSDGFHNALRPKYR